MLPSPAPEPSSLFAGTARRRTFLLTAAALLVLLAGLACFPRDPWEWDEVEFLSALKDFSIRESRPHPPGFPYFVLLGRVLDAWIGNGLAALVLPSLLGALLSFFGLFRLASGWLGNRFDLALPIALCYALSPPQWWFSAVPFSDSLGNGLALFGLSLLVPGPRRTTTKGAVAGALCHALALGIRPPVVFFLFWPWLLFTLHSLVKGPRRPFFAASVVLLVGCLPILLVLSHNIGSLAEVLRLFREYDAAVSGRDNLFVSLREYGVLRVGYAWSLALFGGPALGLWFLGWGLLGLLRSGREAAPAVRAALLACLPFLIFCALRMNFLWSSRYALPGMILGPFLAVLGWEAVARGSRIPVLLPALVIGTLGAQAFRMTPQILLVRSERLPWARGLEFCEREAAKPGPPLLLWAPGELGGHLPFLVPRALLLLDWHRALDDRAAGIGTHLLETLEGREPRVFLLSTEKIPGNKPLFEAEWPRLGFPELSRPRLLYASIHEMRRPALPFAGWFAREADGDGWFEVGRRKCSLLLPVGKRPPARLRIEASFYRLLDRERLTGRLAFRLLEDWRHPAGKTRGPALGTYLLEGPDLKEFEVPLPPLEPGLHSIRLELRFLGAEPEDPRVLEVRAPRLLPE